MTTGAEFSPAYRAAAASEKMAYMRLRAAKLAMTMMMQDEKSDIDAMVRNMQVQAMIIGERTRTWREAYDAMQKEEA